MSETMPVWANFAGYNLDSRKCAYLYFGSDDSSTNKLIDRLSRSDIYSLVPLKLFNSNVPDQSAVLNEFAETDPSRFRDLLTKHLTPLIEQIRGIIFTSELSPSARLTSLVCEDLQIERFLLLSETELPDPESFYTNSPTGAVCPLAENIICTGNLQKDLLIKLGVSQKRISVLGNPYLDDSMDYKPVMTRKDLFKLCGLNTEKITYLLSINSYKSHSDAQQLLSYIQSRCSDERYQFIIKTSFCSAIKSDFPKIKDDPAIVFWKEGYNDINSEELVFHTDGVISTGCIMLIKAMLMKKSATAVLFDKINSIWENAGIFTVHNTDELEAFLDNPQMCDITKRQQAAEMFSIGFFDKKSAVRINIFLEKSVFKAIVPVSSHDSIISGERLDSAGLLNAANNIEKFRYLPNLLNIGKIVPVLNETEGSMCSIILSFSYNPGSVRKLFIIKEGLISSSNNCNSDKPVTSVIIGNDTEYYDGKKVSLIEKILNSNLHLNDRQTAAIRSAIKKIKSNKITKYNNMKYSEDFSVSGNAVLIIDQSTNDPRVQACFADETAFENMIESAIADNPENTEFIIYRPEKADAYFLHKGILEKYSNRIRITEADHEIHPHRLFDITENVYTVSSDLGFEALLYGNKVHCSGASFYSNWGVTEDSVTIKRREKKRSLEEIFFAAYMKCSRYWIPSSDKPCNINKYIDYLIKTGARS